MLLRLRTELVALGMRFLRLVTLPLLLLLLRILDVLFEIVEYAKIRERRKVEALVYVLAMSYVTSAAFVDLFFIALTGHGGAGIFLGCLVGRRK